MKKTQRNGLIFIFIILVSISIAPWVLAKPRKTFLTEYLINRNLKDKGFSDSIKENSSISSEATAYALEILDYYDLYEYQEWFEIKANVNVSIMDGKLINKLEAKLAETPINLYDIYYLCAALDYLNTTISSNLEEEIKEFLDSIRKVDGGFAPNNQTEYANVVASYYAVMIHKLIDYSIPNENIHLNWVKDCQKSDGGYGGNKSFSSTIFNTYCAVQAIIELGDQKDLDNEDDTIKYLMDFYVDDEGDQENYGGFLPDSDAKITLLSSTYYCIRTLKLLGENDFETDVISAWVVDHQNYQDGGFSDHTDGEQQKISSVTCTYYAFQILKDVDGLDALEEEIWTVEFNWWILVILLSALGIAVALLILLYKRRKI